ncbi:MAG: O-antigen ligase family protein [Pleurocapsa sp.]
MTNLTAQHQPKTTPFIVYYQGFLAVAAILLFFTRLDIYLQGYSIGIPLYWMIGFLLASLPLFISLLGKLNCLSIPVLAWSAAYIAISLISILIQPKIPDLQYLEDQYRTIIFFLMMLAIFAYHPLVSKWVKLTVLSVTLINVCMFVYEFLNPLAFHLEQRAPGRSSGFYDDSNTASIAIILGMIFTIDMFKPKYRIFYALFIFLGTITTFSRGSILGWIVVVALLVVKKTIPRYQIPLLLLFFLMIISILSTQLGNLKYMETADGTKLFHKDTLARVEFLIDPLGQQDSSKATRIYFIQEAWQKFARHPFIGNGLGAGKSSARISDADGAKRSHNTYLDIMVEFGFLGALIFPSLLLASVWKARGQFKKQAIAFVVFLLIQGFFSHTLLSEFCSLMAYVIMTNLAENSYFESCNDYRYSVG